MSEGDSSNPASSPESAPADGSKNELESVSDEPEIPQEFKGWLNKRTKISHKWKKQWCVLKKTDLFYGDSESDSQSGQMKKISLDGAEIAESDIDKKQYAFRLRPMNTKRFYYFHCDNEDSQNQWMQAICFAKVASKSDVSTACVLQ